MNRSTAWYRRLDWWFVLILFAALAIRILYLNHYRSLPDWSQLKVDHWYLHHWAQSLAGGNLVGDTTYFRAPLYAYLLGLLYAVFGDSLWIARVFGLAVGLLTLTLIYLCAHRAFGRTSGIVAASLYAIYPITIYFESEILADPLFALLLLAAIHCLLAWQERRTLGSLALTAILIGFAAIARPTILVLVPFLIVWLFFSAGSHRKRIVNISIILAGLAVVIAPIFVRNLVVARDPVLIASQGGINLFIGNHAAADGASAVLPEPLGFNWRISDVTFIAEQAEGRTLKPGEVSSYWTARALEWIAAHPVDAARLYARKLWLSVSNREISNNRNMDYFFLHVPYFDHFPFGFSLLLGLACVGAVLTWRAGSSTRTIVSVIAVLLMLNAAFFVSSRFRHPIIPLLMILCGAAVAHVPGVWRLRKRLAVSLVVGVGAFAVSVLPVFRPPEGVNVQPLLARSLEAYANGDYEQSLTIAQQARQWNDSFPEVNLTIGVCFLRLQVPDSARHYFVREIDLFPLRSKAYANLGSLYLVSDDLRAAHQFIRKARALRPHDDTNGLLWIRLLSKDTAISADSLLNELNTVARVVPHNPAIVYEAAAVLIGRGMLREATAMLHKGIAMRRPAIEIDDLAFERDFPNSPARFDLQKAKLFTLLGYVYGQQRQFDDAISNCRTAIILDPADPAPYVNMILGLMSRGDVAAADSLLYLASTRFPDNTRLRELRRIRP